MGGDSRRVLFREARWTRRWLFSIKGSRPAVGEMPVSRSRAVTFRCRVQQRLRDACRASSRVPTARTLYLLAQLGLFFAFDCHSRTSVRRVALPVNPVSLHYHVQFLGPCRLQGQTFVQCRPHPVLGRRNPVRIVLEYLRHRDIYF